MNHWTIFIQTSFKTLTKEERKHRKQENSKGKVSTVLKQSVPQTTLWITLNNGPAG
jgi:hypothetical protein